MAKKVKTSQEPTEGLNRHIEQIRETLLAFQPFLSRRKVTASLEGFDEEAEEVLSETSAEPLKSWKPINTQSSVKARSCRKRPRKLGRTTWIARAFISANRSWKVAWRN